MLGERIEDPAGLEGGPPGGEPGLGLLPLITHYHAPKHLGRVIAQFGTLVGPWAALSGQEVSGYEIHRGETHPTPSGSVASIRPALSTVPASRPIGWQCGSVLALYLHGLFENTSVLSALLGVALTRTGVQFDAMADHIERSFVPSCLDSLAEPRAIS